MRPRRKGVFLARSHKWNGGGKESMFDSWRGWDAETSLTETLTHPQKGRGNIPYRDTATSSDETQVIVYLFTRPWQRRKLILSLDVHASLNRKFGQSNLVFKLNLSVNTLILSHQTFL